MKQRLDELLVARGFFPSRAKAQAAVMAGQVEVDGRPAAKPGSATRTDALLSVRADANPYVSRGGLKLAAALDAFPVQVQGRVCLDVGSSTGGFTDCLLSKGAAKVYAVDVGTAQLHAKLRADPRVVSLEQTHARDMRPGMFSPAPDLAVVDVSFISLGQVLPFVVPCLQKPCELLALLKPQFELEPKLTPKGVVRKPEHRALALSKVRERLSLLPLREAGILECPVHGPKGNIESFLYLKSVAAA
ncbi:MAG TPA: TlyA family rRNA (cytidine-2'-O)-methyltransferase [Elusimicrobia bacterium]|nr:TlyA family rRNA (cytidine-2'-O)-methyltransferase [Elusimicrobiota bacterium]HBT60270.1 TlyA family rRNA (cytidine-2'-O)-methyltransferase [Elusimicrobiota bacterium]